MTQQNIPEWLEQEANLVKGTHIVDAERLPTLKMSVGKITTFTVNFEKPFPKYTGTDLKDKTKTVTKAIIPVLHDGVKCNFWLNIKNPLYAKIVQSGRIGITTFRVIQTGVQADTKYTLVEN